MTVSLENEYTNATIKRDFYVNVITQYCDNVNIKLPNNYFVSYMRVDINQILGFYIFKIVLIDKVLDKMDKVEEHVETLCDIHFKDDVIVIHKTSSKVSYSTASYLEIEYTCFQLVEQYLLDISNSYIKFNAV